MTRRALLERLKELQQTPKFQARDIVSISAMLSIEALAKHVDVCEAGLTPAQCERSRPAHAMRA